MARTTSLLTCLGALLALLGTGCSTPGFGLMASESSLEYRKRLQTQRELAAASEGVTEGWKDEAPSAADRIEAGDLAEKRGDRHRALWNYLEAYRLEPENEQAVLRLGRYYVREDPERAAAIFSSLISRSPETAEAYAGLALARLVQNRHHEAREAVERAIALDPELAQAFETAGVVYSLLGQSDEALQHIERAAGLRPRNPEVLNNLGVAELAVGNFQAAEAAFRAAILQDPQDPVAYNNLGLALGRQGRLDEAAEAFRRFGSRRAVLNNLGYVHYLNGDRDEAIRYYMRAVDVTDGNDGGRQELGTVIHNLRLATRGTEGER